MPLAAAIIGAAVIGGGASMIASGNASRAARDAANQNNATATNIYNQNKANMTPYADRGNAAGSQINALLGLGGTPASQGAAPIIGYDTTDYGGGRANGRTPIYGDAPPASTGVSAGQAANDAFNTFHNSDGYQFRYNQGLDSVQNQYAGRGMLQSGAALKAITNYGQGAASDEFGRYMGYLGGQQATGANAVNGLAAAGGNFVNQTSANNDSAASATGNAALASSGQINSLLSNGLNAYGYSRGSSYGGGGGFNGAGAMSGASNAFGGNGYLSGVSAPKLGFGG